MSQPIEADLLERLNELIETYLQHPDLDNAQLAAHLHLSERNFYRRLRALTNDSPTQYVRNYRLDRVRALVAAGDYRTVNELAHAVGFVNVGHFIRHYRERFGETPLESLRRHGWR